MGRRSRPLWIFSPNFMALRLQNFLFAKLCAPPHNFEFMALWLQNFLLGTLCAPPHNFEGCNRLAQPNQIPSTNMSCIPQNSRHAMARPCDQFHSLNKSVGKTNSCPTLVRGPLSPNKLDAIMIQTWHSDASLLLQRFRSELSTIVPSCTRHTI